MASLTKGYGANKPAKGYLASAVDSMPETFSLDEDDLKEIKTWKVGQTYDLEMTVKLISQREDSMDKGQMRASFEIQDVQVDDDADDQDGED